MESKALALVELSPGYHAQPGPTTGHLHDIYTTLPPLGGNDRIHVGALARQAVDAWSNSRIEMATAILFALEHDDDRDVADFLRDWMKGDTSRWFEFTPKYRAALEQRAADFARLAQAESAWCFDVATAPRDGTLLDLSSGGHRHINYRWDAEGRFGGWWSDARHKDRHWRDREFLMPSSVEAWRIADDPSARPLTCTGRG